MKDKFISFLLTVVVTILIFIILIFGYTMYSEITDNDVIQLNFIGDSSINIGKDSSNNNTITVQADEELFSGVNGESNTSQNLEETNISEVKYLYEQLDDTAKTIYNKLYDNKENLKTGTYVVQFGNTFQTLLSSEGGEKELKKQYQSAIEALIYENPEIFYIDVTNMYINIEKITKLTSVKYNVYIDCGNNPNYLGEGFNSKQDVEKYETQIEQVKDYILSLVNGKSDYEKIKIIHDYLIDTIEYDSTVSKDNIYNIYGALVSRVCVCEGYAKAFQYLMNEIGIKNTIVIGTGTNSNGNTENHAWNYVELNGNWYAVDVTWDDPILIGNGILPESSKYQYFLKGSKTMSQNHITSGKFTEGGQEFNYPQLSVEDY